MPGTLGAGCNAAGRDRIERLKTLHGSFTRQGIEVRLDVVPEAEHDGTKVFPAMMEFFRQQLE